MANKPAEVIDVSTILSRLDRSSSDALLGSIAKELAGLHQSLNAVRAQLAAVEVSQTLFDRVAPSQAVDDEYLPHSVTIDAAFSLAAESGFHSLDYDNAGAPYRWTGPEPTFYFELMVDRSGPAKLRMRFSQFYADVQNKVVPCYVDGMAIETHLVEVDGEFEIQAVVPARSDVGGTVVLFSCPRLQSPAEREYSTDDRKLGLAFRWLKFDVTAGLISDIVDSVEESTDEEEIVSTASRKVGKSSRRNRSTAAR